MTKGKIEAALERLDKLGSGENAEEAIDAQGSVLHVGPLKLVTSASYSVLRLFLSSTLNRIKHKLQAVLGHVGAADYTGNEEDVRVVSGLMDEIRDAVMDYQVSDDPDQLL